MAKKDTAARGASSTPREMVESPLRAQSVIRPVMRDLFVETHRALEGESEHGAPGVPSEAHALLIDATRARASDIHLDPRSDGYVIRFRVDGVLIDSPLLSFEQGSRLVNQIKGAAGIDPINVFSPKESRFTVNLLDKDMDLRLALAPALGAEKLTVRMLETARLIQHPDQLGLAARDMNDIEWWLSGLNGMFAVTGPNNSGKTTTLYTLLHELKMTNRAVVTIEDPVEYHIDGITQIQVDLKNDLDFAAGIKISLRLDPNYLLLGEMRDPVSARAATEAATTGTALMTTLHCRDAAAAVTRLRNLGVEDHEIVANLAVVVAQRLTRKLCRECRVHDAPTDRERRWLESVGAEPREKVWRGVGCEACNDLGYLGQTGLFEVWRLQESDYQLIGQHVDERALRAGLLERGHQTLLDDAIEKADEGITSISELWSVPALTMTTV